MNYENDLAINKNKLDEEFIKQPDLMLSYSEELTKLQKECNDQKEKINYMKDEVNTLKSQISLDYRSGKIEVDMKLTETAIDQLTTTNKEVIEMNDNLYKEKLILNEKQEMVDKFSGIVESLRHKKVSLENLTTLWLSGYYSQPNENKVMDNVRDSQRIRLNRKNK